VRCLDWTSQLLERIPHPLLVALLYELTSSIVALAEPADAAVLALPLQQPLAETEAPHLWTAGARRMFVRLAVSEANAKKHKHKQSITHAMFTAP
jgi:hypothetical protein